MKEKNKYMLHIVILSSPTNYVLFMYMVSPRTGHLTITLANVN